MAVCSNSTTALLSSATGLKVDHKNGFFIAFAELAMVVQTGVGQ
jgi:hypothetical protein